MSGLKPDNSLSIPGTPAAATSSTIEKEAIFTERERDPCTVPGLLSGLETQRYTQRQLQEHNRCANQSCVFKHLKDLDTIDREIRQHCTSTPPQPDAI